jgi:hypothetical protein
MPRCDSIFMGRGRNIAQGPSGGVRLERAHTCTDLAVQAAYFCTSLSAGMNQAARLFSSLTLRLDTKVRDETAETGSKTSGGSACRQACCIDVSRLQ